MVSSELELSPKKIHVVISDAENDGETFFLNLAVVFLR